MVNGSGNYIVGPDGAPLIGASGPLAFRAASSDLLERYRFAKATGLTFSGARDVQTVLGYNDLLTNRDYWQRYRRGGLAKRIVDVYSNATWRGEMELVEDENPDKKTKFEQAWLDLDVKHQLQAKLHRVDKLSTLSTYSVLVIGAPGPSETEIPKGDGTSGSLLYFRPALGGGGGVHTSRHATIGLDATAIIDSWEIDPQNPRFGLPLTYRIKVADGIPALVDGRSTHWSRILHVAENCLEDDVFGTPGLECVWNLLDDLEKVTGGGAESFWLRANQGMHIDIDKDMPLADANLEKAALKDQAELYKHQLERWIRTRGVKVDTLGSDVANFQGPADAIITQIAGAKGIPKRILTGSEMGELASSQDRENWRDQIVGRQNGYATPYIIRPLIERLIAYNYLPEPKKGIRGYAVKWPNIEILTEVERMQGAQTWAATKSSEGQVFTNAETRDKWYGKQPLSDEEQAKIKPAPPVVPATTDDIDNQDDGKDTAKGETDDKRTEPSRAGKVAPFRRVAQAPPEALRIAQDKPREFSSTQVQLPKVIAQKLLAYGRSIPDEDLAEDGREDDPHVTVKYGLHTNSDSDVREALAEMIGPVKITFGKTAMFTADEYDVLYVAVKSPDLVALNKKISSTLETTDTHQNYTPHACVAYLKPGLGKKYVGDDRFDGLTAEMTTIVFSNQESEKSVIDLGLRAAAWFEDEAEMIRVLEDAITEENVEVIDQILGIQRAVEVNLEANGEHNGTPEAPVD